jgi:hypothetical protein
LDIKSRFKQTIQNLTSQNNQKQNATHLQLIDGFKANANLEITNGVIFDKVISHQVNVAMKHGIDYDGNNPLQ